MCFKVGLMPVLIMLCIDTLLQKQGMIESKVRDAGLFVFMNLILMFEMDGNIFSY